MENKEFKYVDSYSNSHSIAISSKDFELVQKDKKLHDVKFEGKPTTFFKDSMKRFVKNKSSVVGACILGLIVLCTLIVPFTTGNVDSFNIKTSHTSGTDGTVGMKGRSAITPKLFNNFGGFWDGTIKKENIVYDVINDHPVGYPSRAISDLESWDTYSTTPGTYGVDGQIVLTTSSIYSGSSKGENPGDYYSYAYDFDFNNDYTLTYSISNLNEGIKYNESLNFENKNLNAYQDSEYRISLITFETSKVGSSTVSRKVIYPLTGSFSENKGVYSSDEGFIKEYDTLDGSHTLDVSKIMKERFNVESLAKASICIDVARQTSGDRGAILINELKIESKSDENQDELESRSITNPGQTLAQKSTYSVSGSSMVYDNHAYWTSSTGATSGNAIKYVYSNFKYDQYEDVFGDAEITLEAYLVNSWIKKGYISFEPGDATTDKTELSSRIKILSSKCPIVEITGQNGNATYNSALKEYEGFSLTAVCTQYKIFGYSKMPRFIFGTDANGRDFCKVIFTALRTSLLIAVGVSLINIAFGLIWGAISGYYGGWTDIVMERFCDILSGIPSVAIITLTILYLNNDMLAFLLSMFLTGWMGVAGRTRTQFYRYKGREYVLASRSLGAKDGRLIFRHILPNSLGTIITSSILMIPSVIYSEASIAYLNLGLSSEMLFGVILSQNRNEFSSYRVYLLVIPTMIMLFLLISFNLFGNGLRDAFNPQLKGSE